MSTTPAKRFERTPAKYKWITKRDLEIVRFVYLARYATKNQVRDTLFSPSTDSSCKRRLRLLFVKGYLRKRDARSIEPDVYYLGLRGRRYIASLGTPQETVDRVCGITGVGGMHMEHDLTVTDLLVSLIRQSKAWGMNYQWSNTRLTSLQLKEYKVEPDAWFSIERNGKSKEAYIEFTDILPTPDEWVRKLVGYESVPGETPILWFTTSQAKVNKVRERVGKSAVAQRVLVGLIEDKRGFLTEPMWWHVDSDTQVSWIKILGGVTASIPTREPTVSPRVSIPSLED